MSVTDLALRRGAEHLYRCGPRAIAEFLHQLGTSLDAQPAIKAQLEAWRTVNPATVGDVLTTYTNGRQFPPTLTEVPHE
jgi:hypothetical protein